MRMTAMHISAWLNVDLHASVCSRLRGLIPDSVREETEGAKHGRGRQESIREIETESGTRRFNDFAELRAAAEAKNGGALSLGRSRSA